MERASLRAYQRRTKAADALIAGAYFAGTNTHRVRRALSAVCTAQRRRVSEKTSAARIPLDPSRESSHIHVHAAAVA